MLINLHIRAYIYIYMTPSPLCLVYVCSGVEGLVSLRRLDLGHNRIRRWDEVQRLALLPQLEKLWLEGNPVADIAAYRIKARGRFTVDRHVMLSCLCLWGRGGGLCLR